MCLRRLFRETVLGRKSGQLALGCGERGKRANRGECQPVPGGTKGHRVGRRNSRKRHIWQARLLGLGQPPPGGSRGWARTGRAWECPPQAAGARLCDLGQVSWPLGLSFPKSAKRMLCKMSRWSPFIMGMTGGRCGPRADGAGTDPGPLATSRHPPCLPPGPKENF